MATRRAPQVFMSIAAFAACVHGLAHEAIAGILASPDHPQCYEVVGCPHKDRISAKAAGELSCENLSLVRNTIFHQHGYCFETKAQMEIFDNSQCHTHALAELHLSKVERANVATLQRVEKRKQCPVSK